MQAKLGLSILAFLGLLLLPAARAQGQGESPYIFQVIASRCQHEPLARTQTGFQLQDSQGGLITALHGVADCQVISAVSSYPGSKPIQALAISKLDIVHDVALLQRTEDNSVASADGGLEPAFGEIEIGPVYVIGHPYGIYSQLRNDELRVRAAPLQMLRTLLPPNGPIYALNERQSPALEIDVLSLEGHLVPGHSGAPIFNRHNQVVGIANGGLEGGSTGIVWAIPLQSIEWMAVEDATEELGRLQQKSPSYIFSFPQSETLVQANEQLQLRLTLTMSSNREAQLVIDQTVSSTVAGSYLLPIPSDVRISRASVVVTKRAENTVLAQGRIDIGLQSTVATHQFRVTNADGYLILSVQPRADGLQAMPELIFSGRIVDQETQEPVIGIAVMLDVLEAGYVTLKRIAETDARGVYRFHLPRDVAGFYGRIKVDTAPYSRYVLDVQLDGTVPDIELISSIVKEVAVPADKPLPVSSSSSTMTPMPTLTLGEPTATPITPTHTPTSTATPNPGVQKTVEAQKFATAVYATIAAITTGTATPIP